MKNHQPREEIDALIASGQERAAARHLGELWRCDQSLGAASFVVSRFEALRDRVALVPFRVAILRSCCTLEPVVPLLQAQAFTYGLDLAVYLGGFNAYRDEALDHESTLHRFKPDAVILAAEVYDLAPELWWGSTNLQHAEREDVVRRTVATFSDFVSSFRHHSSAALVIHNAEHPLFPSSGILEAQNGNGQSGAIAALNRGLQRIAAEHHGVYLLDYDGLIARHGRLHWRDWQKWWGHRLPVAGAHLRHLAEEWFRYLIALAGKVAKVAVVDLDGTLWGGIVGEDGPSGIQIGSEYPGAAYLELQRALLDFYHRGILLAICSKNNLQDAMEVLEKHSGMLLRPQHFSAMRINWNDKAQSLREIASELSVGMDALAYLDDNPAERERVREASPEVTVVEMPPDPAEYARAVRECPVFERLRLSDEDLQRSRYYLNQRQRAELQRDLSSLEEFYRSLRQEVEISRVQPSTLARVAQLTQKTNQFNLTTRRYTEEQIARMTAVPTWEVYSLRARDRFGDNGLVGVAITRNEDGTYEIDSLLLSCRVIGRTVESAFLAFLVSRARELRAREVRGWFLPTAKNLPARNFYRQHGFHQVDRTEEGSLWALGVQNANVRCPDWIEMNISEERNELCDIRPYSADRG